MNESGPYDWTINSSGQQTYGTWNVVWDSNYCDDVVKFDKLGCASLSIITREMDMAEGGTFDQMAEQGTLVKRDTLEELAEGLNLRSTRSSPPSSATTRSARAAWTMTSARRTTVSPR